ncbi:uncharacterized protein LOC130893180 [Diorhabda carinulata]|uniref:uncharacterized protein LOC130893180 n=1 Tax=Diorhabda carinulata TaxID=1163345 RepID=UPI0025A1B3CA|nr:uncharacterized protein LOC130893180 [Diorhabda carinulata]XP_057655049.1 uncharacterized protein LOC130893180 [Diorhabda carinulata]
MSSIDKYSRNIRSSIERKRSEVILRLSELDEAVRSKSPPRYLDKTTTDIRQNMKLSGAQRRKLGIERAMAIGAPIRPRKRRKPRLSPRRTSRSSRSPNNRKLYSTDKYDPAFPTKNESIRNKESLRYDAAPSHVNRSRSPFHRSLPDNRIRSSPGRSGRNFSPDRRGRNHISRSPGRTRLNSHSADRRDGNRLYGNYHVTRNDKLDSSIREKNSRGYNLSTHVVDVSSNRHTYKDNRYHFDVPTNDFVVGNVDSRWHDSSSTLNSYRNDYGPGDMRMYDQIDRYPNTITSNNTETLRSRNNEEELPIRRHSDREKNTNTDIIRLSIVPVDYPKGILTKSQADEIELALISHIKPGKAGTGPQFSYMSFLQKTLIAGCKNFETKRWLEDVVPKLKIRNVGTLKILSTRELERTDKLPKVTMFVPNPIAKKPTSTLLSLIKTQNVGLETENWRILGLNDKPGGMSLTLLIDNNSLATLEKLNLKACLGLTQAKFTIIRGRKESGNQ